MPKYCGDRKRRFMSRSVYKALFLRIGKVIRFLLQRSRKCVSSPLKPPKLFLPQILRFGVKLKIRITIIQRLTSHLSSKFSSKPLTLSWFVCKNRFPNPHRYTPHHNAWFTFFFLNNPQRMIHNFQFFKCILTKLTLSLFWIK